MGGWFSFFKSRRRQNSGRGNVQGNARQNIIQPAGNEAYSNDDMIVNVSRHPFRSGGNAEENQSSVFSNELMNIMNWHVGRNDQAEDIAGGPARTWRSNFDKKISGMGREELRNLFLRVKTQGEQILDDPEYSYFTRRAYDFSEDDLANDEFNPDHDEKLEQVQNTIDNAGSVPLAYKAFMEFAGNPDARLLTEDKKAEWTIPGVRPDRFKMKLKLMARMIHDYPELKGKIGDMMEIASPKKRNTVMATSGVYPGQDRAEMWYNSSYDTGDPQGRYLRPSGTDINSYAGNHELGHVLESLLVEGSDANESVNNWNNHVIAGGILKDVLSRDEIMSPQERRKLVYHKHTRKHHVAGQINTESSKLDEKGITTKYGASSGGELFAEAFRDVYQFGKKARKASIEIVKNYERKVKKRKIIQVLRRRDSAWLLHQLYPEKHGYSEAEERARQGVKNTMKEVYLEEHPDFDLRLFDLPRKPQNPEESKKLDQWDIKASAKMRELERLPGGMRNDIYDQARQDIVRVKNIAMQLIANDIELPPLPDFDSKGVNPHDMLIFLIMSKAYQHEKLSELNQNNPNGGAAGQPAEEEPLIPVRDSKGEEPKQAAEEPLIPIRDSRGEEPKKPEGEPKNVNIINENLPPRNSIYLNVGLASMKNLQPSSVSGPTNLNSKLSIFAKPPSAPQVNQSLVSQVQPDNGKPEKSGNKRNWYNKTELRVMEIVEAIENGEMIRFKLKESARSKIRQSILDRVQKAQEKVEAYINENK